MDRNTYWLLGVVLLGTALSVHSQVQRHSLSYTYTALSKPSGLPGIHDFTAMGLLDDRMIDYFDSSFNEKVPKQPWMEKKLPADYWEKGTKSRKSKHQWFKVNLDILMKRKRQNDTESHVLQWQHGCEAEVDPSTNELKFVKGKDRYSYDGHDFLYFDNANDVWVAAAQEAEETKRKWDEVQVLKEYTKGYLEKECMKWLTEFTGYETEQLKNDSRVRPPEIYVFAKHGKLKENVVLTCFTTGFLPKEIELLIKRDGRILTMDDGVRSSGSRPNDDGTYQRKDWVEILKSDKSIYSCEVIHAASGVQVETPWDHKIVTPPEERGPPIAIVACAIVGLAVCIIVVVLVVVLRRKGSRKSAPNMADAELESVETPPNGADQPLLNGQDSKSSQDGGSIGLSASSTSGAKDSQDNRSTGSSGYNSTGAKDSQDTGSTGSTGSSGYNGKGAQLESVETPPNGADQPLLNGQDSNSSQDGGSIGLSASSTSARVRPPEVYVFANDGKLKENVVLSCLATGFLPKEIELLIKRDGCILTMDDGVRSSDSRPNDDRSYQRMDWVEILKSDKSTYSCEVIHAASGVQVEKYWGAEDSQDNRSTGSSGYNSTAPGTTPAEA